MSELWIKPNGEMPFLYGGNVVKAHVGRWSEGDAHDWVWSNQMLNFSRLPWTSGCSDDEYEWHASSETLQCLPYLNITANWLAGFWGHSSLSFRGQKIRAHWNYMLQTGGRRRIFERSTWILIEPWSDCWLFSRRILYSPPSLFICLRELLSCSTTQSWCSQWS